MLDENVARGKIMEGRMLDDDAFTPQSLAEDLRRVHEIYAGFFSRMRALSLLYRQDLGRDLDAVLQFQIGGEGGGSWHVALSPDHPRSARRAVSQPDLKLSFRDSAVFCRMFSGRFNLLGALLRGR